MGIFGNYSVIIIIFLFSHFSPRTYLVGHTLMRCECSGSIIDWPILPFLVIGPPLNWRNLYGISIIVDVLPSLEDNHLSLRAKSHDLHINAGLCIKIDNTDDLKIPPESCQNQSPNVIRSSRLQTMARPARTCNRRILQPHRYMHMQVLQAGRRRLGQLSILIERLMPS